MTDRITAKNLEGICDRINKATGNHLKPWSSAQRTDGSYIAAIGNYHISGAYGGVSLHQMTTEGGGITDVFSCGHIPKRDLWNRMHAFLTGINASKS